MRVFLVVLVVWLLIGALAAWQRHYYAASSAVSLAWSRSPGGGSWGGGSSGGGSPGGGSPGGGSPGEGWRASRVDTAARIALRPAPRGTLRDT